MLPGLDRDDVRACAGLVERGDPVRFRAAMAAPVAQRGALFILYAFNLEVARAPWITAEAMIAEMRLQWWLDALDEVYRGKAPRAHEVMTPLADLIRRRELPRSALEGMVSARRWDIYKDPHADDTALQTYLGDTAGGLMLASAQALADVPDGDTVVAYGRAAGVAGYLLAIPELENAQRYPLVDGRPEAVAGLATSALSALDQARANLQTAPKSLRPALRAAWMARPVLRRAMRAPNDVAAGALAPGAARQALRLARMTMLDLI